MYPGNYLITGNETSLTAKSPINVFSKDNLAAGSPWQIYI